MNLSNVKSGQKVCVTFLNVKGDIRRRLLDIGLTEGTEIKCLGASPCGDPKAFLIRGAVIALRNEDVKCIEVSQNGAD